MAYIINISFKRIGKAPPRHVFRTAPDSIASREAAIAICRQLEQAYPLSHYEINLSHDETYTHSQYIDWENENV